MRIFSVRTCIDPHIVPVRTWIAVYSGFTGFTLQDRTRFDGCLRAPASALLEATEEDETPRSAGTSGELSTSSSLSSSTGMSCELARPGGGVCLWETVEHRVNYTSETT